MFKHLLIDLPALNDILWLQRLQMRSSANLLDLQPSSSFPYKLLLVLPFPHCQGTSCAFCSSGPICTSVFGLVITASSFVSVFLSCPPEVYPRVVFSRNTCHGNNIFWIFTCIFSMVIWLCIKIFVKTFFLECLNIESIFTLYYSVYGCGKIQRLPTLSYMTWHLVWNYLFLENLSWLSFSILPGF